MHNVNGIVFPMERNVLYNLRPFIIDNKTFKSAACLGEIEG